MRGILTAESAEGAETQISLRSPRALRRIQFRRAAFHSRRTVGSYGNLPSS